MGAENHTSSLSEENKEGGEIQKPSPTDSERFRTAEKFGGLYAAQIFYSLKDISSAKKSSAEVFTDKQIFDPEKIQQELRIYIENEWLNDEKELPGEFISKIQALVEKLYQDIIIRIQRTFDERKSQQDLEKRLGETIEDSSFFPG